MARPLQRTEVARTEAARSGEQADELFDAAVASIGTLQGAFDYMVNALHEVEASATGLVIHWVDRLLLAGALNGHLTDAKTRLGEARVAMDGVDIAEVVQAGRQAYSDVDRLGKVVGLLGALTTARRTTLGALSSDGDRYYHDFEALLAGEYRDFASRENYPEEADAFADLQKLFARLGELRMAPRLASRNICAVAGGFSSGKSSFLNALIGEDILPTNITRTTSIPTYIFHVDGTSGVDAFNHHGGNVEIDGDTFKEMTHDFKRHHNVELKRLVHRVSIYTQALSSWRNLALIDTPGYSNPDDGGTTGPDGAEQRDEDIALANVLKSQFLIWVVDCDKGTLHEQDTHFIRQFVEERSGDAEGKLYLVLNKGDKKGEDDRQAILHCAEEIASANEIPFAGIGVYSAHQNKWYAHHGQSFDEFLQAVDQAQSSATTGLEAAVEKVFQRYIDHHEQEEGQLGAAAELLDRLSELTSRDGLEKLDADLKQRRSYLRNARSAHEQLRDEAQRLQKRFATAVKGFVEGVEATTSTPRS